MRKLLGFGLIEPCCMNPYKDIIYKILCLSRVFIPAEGMVGGENTRVHIISAALPCAQKWVGGVSQKLYC